MQQQDKRCERVECAVKVGEKIKRAQENLKPGCRVLRKRRYTIKKVLSRGKGHFFLFYLSVGDSSLVKV
jgi:hypothetical protein